MRAILGNKGGVVASRRSDMWCFQPLAGIMLGILALAINITDVSGGTYIEVEGGRCNIVPGRLSRTC